MHFEDGRSATHLAKTDEFTSQEPELIEGGGLMVSKSTSVKVDYT
jgi:hypothetical protein